MRTSRWPTGYSCVPLVLPLRAMCIEGIRMASWSDAPWPLPSTYARLFSLWYKAQDDRVPEFKVSGDVLATIADWTYDVRIAFAYTARLHSAMA